MTDASWEDYVDLSGVDATDPATAVPEISTEINDFADGVDLVGGVSDLDQVSLDTAAYQTDLATDQQSWADWNSGIADNAVEDSTYYVDQANDFLADGNVSAAEASFGQAETAIDYADTKYDAADANEVAAGYELADAGSSLDSVDYSGLDTAMDTSATDYSLDTSATDYSADSGLDFSTDTSTDL